MKSTDNIARYELNDKNVPFKNKITLDNIQTDINTAKELHGKISERVQKYHDIINVTGSEKVEKIAGRSSISTKLVKKQTEWRCASLTSALTADTDLFTVKPRTWEASDNARQNQILLNYQFNVLMEKQKFIDKFVRSTCEDGFSIVRVGWKMLTSKEETDIPVYDFYEVNINDEPEYAQVISNAIELYTSSRKEFEKLSGEIQQSVLYTLQTNQANTTGSMMLYRAVVSAYKKENITYVDKNEPVLDFIEPKNFWVDPNCNGNLQDAMFVAHTYYTSLSDLMLRYPKAGLDKLNLENENGYNSLVDINPDISVNQPSGRTRKQYSVVEYWGKWDVDGDGVLQSIVVTVVSNVIIDCKLNPFPDKEFPFVIVPYMFDRDSVFGFSDAELIGDNQKIQSACMRASIDLIGRSANAQWGYAKGSLDPINQKKFLSGMDFEYNSLNGVTKPFEMLTAPEVPSSIFNLISIQTAEAESLSGIKSFGEGLSSSSYGNVAAGIKSTVNATALRESSILARICDGLSKIGSKIISLNKSFLRDEEIIRITNESNNQISLPDNYITIYRSALKGDFDVSIGIITAAEKELRKGELATMLQTMGNTLPFEMTQLLLAEYAELSRSPTLAHQIRTYQPPQNPLDELELKKYQVEIEKTLAETELKKAQANYWMTAAKQGQLDFVETESGVKQERSLQKMRVQAEAQANLAERQTELDILKGKIESATKHPTSNNTELDSVQPSILFQ